MDITRIESSVDTHAATFDSLARSLDSRHQRRRVFGLLAAAVATGVLGTASRSQEAQAKNKRKKKGRKKGGKGGQGTPGGDTGNETPPGTPPPGFRSAQTRRVGERRGREHVRLPRP